MAWCVEQDSILKQLWLAHSAQEVAAHITKATNKKTTKNAVISRARRLRLPTKTVGRRPKAPTQRTLKNASLHATTRLGASAQPGDASRAKLNGLAPTRTLLTLGRRECRFPIDIFGADHFGFCGRETDGHSYCDAHKRDAYVVGPKRALRPRDGQSRHPASTECAP